MAAQLLHRPRRMAPADVVRHLLGVQAQLMSAAQMALGARTDGLTPEGVERARVDERSIVLTWAMRGTLHLLAAEDLGWLHPLVIEPKVAWSHRRLAQLGMPEREHGRAMRAIHRMLDREGPLTRAEIMQRLRRSRIRAEGDALGYHLPWLAASGGGVCHGPIRAGERTFVLLRDWIGEQRAMERDAALTELAVRYLAAHEPAAPTDLAAWSGLRLGDANRAWREVADRLVELAGPAGTLWSLRSRPEQAPTGLVRGFVASSERWKLINRGGGWLHPVVLADGRAEGTWKGERTPKVYRVQVRPFDRLSSGVRTKVGAEAGRLGAFLGRGTDAEVRFGDDELHPR
jgi:hypothetical protein